MSVDRRGKNGSCTSLQPLNHVFKRRKGWKGELKDKERKKQGWSSVASSKLKKTRKNIKICWFFAVAPLRKDGEHWRQKHTHYTERKALSKELENKTKRSKKSVRLRQLQLSCHSLAVQLNKESETFVWWDTSSGGGFIWILGGCLWVAPQYQSNDYSLRLNINIMAVFLGHIGLRICY